MLELVAKFLKRNNSICVTSKYFHQNINGKTVTLQWRNLTDTTSAGDQDQRQHT